MAADYALKDDIDIIANSYINSLSDTYINNVLAKLKNTTPMVFLHPTEKGKEA